MSQGLQKIAQSKYNDPVAKYVQVRKLDPRATGLVKDEHSTNEFCITLIGRTDNRTEDNAHEVNEFRTGLEIYPPKNKIILVYPDRNLYRQGYELVGPLVLTDTNRGELIVPLKKFNEADDIILPFEALRCIVLESGSYFAYCNSSSDQSNSYPSERSKHKMSFQPVAESEYFGNSNPGVSNQKSNHFF